MCSPVQHQISVRSVRPCADPALQSGEQWILPCRTMNLIKFMVICLCKCIARIMPYTYHALGGGGLVYSLPEDLE